jgi:hypothetical protein
VSRRRTWRTAAVLALGLSAPACSLLRDTPPPLSPAEAAAVGCYASTTGWFHFGIDPMLGDTAETSWLVLQPARNGSGTLAARFVGTPGVDAYAGDDWDERRAPAPGVGDTDAPARWRVQGDTVYVVWGPDADGLRLRAKLGKDGLRGWGTNPTGRISRDDAGVWVPVECDWEMRAVRVPCDKVPRKAD